MVNQNDYTLSFFAVLQNEDTMPICAKHLQFLTQVNDKAVLENRLALCSRFGTGRQLWNPSLSMSGCAILLFACVPWKKTTT